MLSISDVKPREIADILGAEHAANDDIESVLRHWFRIQY